MALVTLSSMRVQQLSFALLFFFAATFPASSSGFVTPSQPPNSTSRIEIALTMTASDSNDDPLLSIIQRSFPDAESYEVDDNIKQANAEGFVLTVQVQGISKNSTSLFVKRVEAHKYKNKPWGDLRRTLLYARTEARFYSDILPLLKEKTQSTWDIAPNCHLAETTLHGLVEEHESTSAKESETAGDPSYDENEFSILHEKGGLLVLDSMKGQFYQTSPLTPDEARRCLKAIANFHATGFQDETILNTVAEKLCEYGGSYHLKNRNPKELQNIQQTWKDFSDGFAEAAPELFERDSIKDLAKRIQEMAEYISQELSPAAIDKYATIVHGDYKAMNIFLPIDNSESYPIVIDFASTGLGLGMSDVAMHITHALDPEHLINGGEEAFVDAYLEALEEALPDHHSYPRDVALRHYRLAVIDYFRFIMGRLWRGATLETFEKRKDSKNSVYVNRSVEAAINFIQRADRYLTEFEEERAKL
jgi:thiamine kinase-like enzyme